MKPNRKLKKPETCSKLILEEIIGLTVKNANGLASCISNSTCVYIAGCVVVVYNVDSSTQTHLMVNNRSPKPLSCVVVSQDGKFIAAGESGHQPSVLVWDAATLAFVCELKGHQYGVACMAFSPDGKHIASVGFPHDGYLCLWDYRNGNLVTKLKASSSFSAVASVTFSFDANFIITAGKKHLKCWIVGNSTRSLAKNGSGSMGMHGKPVNLGRHKGCSFISIASLIRANSNLADCNKVSADFPIYALTNSGVLCLLNGGVTITNSVDLKVEKAFAVSASSEFVACACNNGVVKLFMIDSLEYVGSLLYNEVKGCNTVKETNYHGEISKNEFHSLSTLPDAIACQFSTSKNLVVVYRDHTLYVWNIHDRYKATKSCVLVSHSACIWDIKNLSCENMHDPSLACVARGCPGGVSFATCSADGTIRLWDLALQQVSLENRPTLATGHPTDINDPFGTACLVSGGIFERESVVSGNITQGYRAMAVSSDGKHLAAGDCDGNLHIYNLDSSAYTCIQDAHDTEILSLSFSFPVKRGDIPPKGLENHYLLASGGKDRMIHIYDVDRNYDLIASTDDHSAAVTSVKLTGNGHKLLSCSADRSLVFRDVSRIDHDYTISRCHHQMASHGTVYDMVVDPLMEVAVTVGQDKKINTFSIASGLLIRSFKQEGDFGDPIKVTLDPSGSYVVCSYSNRSICMYDFMSGEMLARAVGHSEVITGIIFLPDCEHIISVGSDGCIFVWRVPTLLSSKMQQKIMNNPCPLPSCHNVQAVASRQINFFEGYEHLCKTKSKDLSLPENSKQTRLPCQGGCLQEASTFKFSISRLPPWAQSKVTSPIVVRWDSEFTSCKEVGVEPGSPSIEIDREYAPVQCTLRTPSNNDSDPSKNFPGNGSRSSSDNSTSQGYPMPQEARKSFALDNRWLTIHTVCLDMLNSPEACGMKDLTKPISSEEDPSMEANDHEHVKFYSKDSSVNNSCTDPISLLCNQDDQQGVSGLSNISSSFISPGQLVIKSASACHDKLSELSEQMQSDRSVNQGQEDFDSNICNRFKTEGRTSSARKSYSGRFVVRRDLLKDQKQKLLDAPITDLNTIMDPSILECEDSKKERTNVENMKKSTQESLNPNCTTMESGSSGSSSTSWSTNMELVEVKGEEDYISKEKEKQKTMLACREALLTLDASTENALQEFSKLQNLVSEESPLQEPEVQLYSDAAAMLPSIAKKVQALAKIAQSTYNSPSGQNGLDVSSFEPLLGTFAENLSHRVLEILRKNQRNI